MSNTESVDVSLRIANALRYARAGNDEELRPHYLALAEQVLGELKLPDLTTAELVTLVAVLIPARSRLLSGTEHVEHGTVLRFIRGGDDPVGDIIDDAASDLG